MLEFADALRGRACKAALLVTEEFAFDQIFGNGRAIDRRKGPSRAQAVLVNAICDQLLARAAFARDQYGGIARRHLANDLEDFLHRRGIADDAFLIVLAVDLLARFGGRSQVAGRADGARSHAQHLLRIEGLHHVIVGPEFHRFDRRLSRSEGGHEDDLQILIQGAHVLERFQTSDPAHANIHEDQVRRRPVLDLFDAFLAAGSRVNAVALAA